VRFDDRQPLGGAIGIVGDLHHDEEVVGVAGEQRPEHCARIDGGGRQRDHDVAGHEPAGVAQREADETPQASLHGSDPELSRDDLLHDLGGASADGEQARVAAINMCGGDRVYDAIPWFWSDQYELKLQMVGFSSDGDTEVLRGDESKNQFAVFYLKDGKVVAVDAVNSPREFMVCKQLYGKPVDPEKLGDPDVDLKTLIPG